MLVGSRRAHLVSSSELAARLVSTSLMYVGLKAMPSIPVLVGAQLAGKLVYWIRIRHNAGKHVPEAAIDFRLASWRSLAEMSRYGSKNGVIDVSGLLVNRKDVTLTTIFLGPQWVATYSFARIAVRAFQIWLPTSPNRCILT